MKPARSRGSSNRRAARQPTVINALSSLFPASYTRESRFFSAPDRKWSASPIITTPCSAFFSVQVFKAARQTAAPKPQRLPFPRNTRPYRELFLSAKKHPIRDCKRGPAAASAYLVKERRTYANARTIRKIIKIGHRLVWIAYHSRFLTADKGGQ